MQVDLSADQFIKNMGDAGAKDLGMSKDGKVHNFEMGGTNYSVRGFSNVSASWRPS